MTGADGVLMDDGSSLPLGWAWATIGELCDVNPRDFNSPLSDDDLLSRVPMASVEAESGRMDASLHVRYGDVKSKSLTPFQENDVLFAKITPCMENGKISLALDLKDGRAVGSTEFFVLRTRGAILPRYLMHYLLQSEIRRTAERHMTGAVGQRRVPRQYLEGLRIPVPPISEQHRIVAKIDEQLSHIETGEKSAKAAQQQYRALRGSTINSTILGEFNTAADIAPVTDGLSEIRNRISKKLDYTNLPPLPVGWKWRVASEICSLITSGSTPQAPLMHAGAGDVPFLKVYNITQDGIVDFTIRPTFVDRSTHDTQLKRSRVRPGDVLTNIVGPPLGKTAVVPSEYSEWNINQAIVAFRAGPEISPQWLSMALQSPYLLTMLKRTARATAGQFNIALSTCRDLPIPLPPLDEQDTAIKFAESALSNLGQAVQLVSTLASQASELRASLLATAFEGNLTTKDATEEPASALLARVSAGHVPTPRRARSPRKKKNTPPHQGELPL